MSLTTEQQRTVEARLDRLERRIEGTMTTSGMKSVIRGLIDLVRDVLIPAESGK